MPGMCSCCASAGAGMLRSAAAAAVANRRDFTCVSGETEARRMAAPPQRLLGGVAALSGRMIGMPGAAVLHLGLIAALAIHLVLGRSARRLLLVLGVPRVR